MVHKMGRHSGTAACWRAACSSACRPCNRPPSSAPSRPDGKDLKQITDFNGDKLALALMGEPEQFTFTGWNDETVYAYVVKPYDWTEKAAAGQKWPVAFLVHGGPQGSFGNDFHYRWNPQAYVGAGFATVAVDFHGSTGYGQDFTDAISGHWGDRPLEDLEKGLAAALRTLPLDGRRPGGGRRRQLRRLHDQLDARPALRRQLQGLRLPRRQPGRADGLLRHRGAVVPRVGARRAPSLVPRTAATASTTPSTTCRTGTCPPWWCTAPWTTAWSTPRALSTFTALRRQGVPARLLYYPDENHWVLKPHNSIQWHDEVMGWLTRWIK